MLHVDKDDMRDIVEGVSIGSTIVLGAKVARHGLGSVSLGDIFWMAGLAILREGLRR